MAAKLSQAQVAGAKIARREAKSVAANHPEIADEWRNGLSHSKLATQYLPGVEDCMAKAIIGYALKILVPKKERRRIGRLHKQQTGSRVGKLTMKSKTGIFGLSQAVRRAASQKGIQKALLTQGKVSYDGAPKLTEFGEMTEKEYIRKLFSVKQKDRRYTWKFICDRANGIFGNNRNWQSVCVKFTHKNSAK